jgi:hypothetical protein
MAQTKRKRRSTKHRGNAAGNIEVRGRTGRKPTESERKTAATGPGGKPRRANRFDSPPTWRGAFNRALVASVVAGVIFVIALKAPIASVLAVVAFMLVIYVPFGYYTDQFLYRRRERAKAAGKVPR